MNTAGPETRRGVLCLAFVSRYKINGIEIPCMKQMLKQLPEKPNEHIFGPPAGELNGRNLSTDTGYTFMSIDGLSHPYGITKSHFTLMGTWRWHGHISYASL